MYSYRVIVMPVYPGVILINNTQFSFFNIDLTWYRSVSKNFFATYRAYVGSRSCSTCLASGHAVLPLYQILSLSSNSGFMV